MNRLRPIFRTEFFIILLGLVIMMLVGVEIILIQNSFGKTIPIGSSTDVALAQTLVSERDLLVRYGWGLILLVLAMFVGLALLWVRQSRANSQLNLELERKITERTRQLREQEADYRRIVETAHEGIVMTGADYRISYVNPRGGEIFAYAPQELIGKLAVELIVPADLEMVTAQWMAPSDGERRKGEFRIRRKTGEEGWVHWTGGPFKAEGNEAVGSLFMFTDITESKRAQHALQASEELYRSLVDVMPLSLARKDCEGRITFGNERFWKFIGASEEQAKGKTEFELLPLPVAERHRAEDIAIMKSGETVDEVEDIELPSGEHQVMRAVKSPVRNEQGAVNGIQVMFWDITEGRQQGELLREREELLSRVLETVEDGIYIVDPNGKMTFSNKAMERMLGVSREEIARASYNDPRWQVSTLDGTPFPDEQEPYRRVMSTGEPVLNVQQMIRHQNGSQVIVSINAAPLHDANGHLIGEVASMTDITERKRAEAKLSESQKTLAKAQEIAHIGSWGWDLRTDHVEWSDQMYEIFGLDRENFDGTLSSAIEEAVHPDDRELVNKVSALARQGIPSPLEYRIVHQDGQQRTVWAEGEIIRDALGNPLNMVGVVQDITERKHAEARQRNLAAIVESANEGIVAKNLDGTVTIWNQGAEKIYGYTPAEMIGNSIRRIIPPELYHEMDEAISRVSQGEQIQELETVRVRKDGTRIDVSLTFSPTFDESGSISGVAAFARDITERKHAEVIRQRQNEYLDALHQTTVRLMGHLDLYDLLQTITQRAANLIGTTHGYIYVNEPGQDYMEMNVGIGLFSQLVGSVTKRGVGATGVVWETGRLLVIDDYQLWGNRLNKQGTNEVRALISVPLMLQDQIIGVFGLAYTDPEQKLDETKSEILTRFGNLAAIAINNARLYDAAQKELAERKQAEEKFRILFAASPDAIILIDPNQPEWPIVDCNQVTCDMNGYTREELIGHSIDLLNTSEGQPEERAEYLQRVREVGVMRVEADHRHKDGHIFPIETSTSLIRLGDSDLVLGIDRDVTKRKEVDRMKTEFISTVSHELRTPLTSIRGSLGLIAGGVAGQIPERAKNMVDIAYKNSERLVRLINDILDVEKIESGKMVFQLKPLELVPLIEQTMEANRGYGEQYRVTFVLTEVVPGVMVNVDSDRMTQVLTNLLSNAAKFSPPQSRVEIGVHRVGTRVRVSVRDHGSGIPEEFKGRIFQKFAQADSSDTRQKGGTGLGLSIVKAIVEKHGGTIGFDTVMGEGTTFYFDLPEYHTALPPGTVAGAHAPRVLIFEDDHDVALLLRMMLSQGGFESDIAYDRQQALEFLGTKHYDALTLDLLLPGDDGIAFIRELRAHYSTQELPVIVVSAQAEQGELRLNGDAVWVADFLQKPINQKQLLRAVGDVVRGTREGKPQILHVEDDDDVIRVVRAILFDTAEVTPAHRVDEAREMLEKTTFDLVILDALLPDGSGIDLLPLLGQNGIQTPVVIFSATDNDAGIMDQVKASLVKSRTSNEQLLQTITHLIPREQTSPRERLHETRATTNSIG